MENNIEYDPYEQMLSILDIAAEKLGYAKNDYVALRYPERELTVAVPVEMEDGSLKVFTGYRTPTACSTAMQSLASLPVNRLRSAAH